MNGVPDKSEPARPESLMPLVDDAGSRAAFTEALAERWAYLAECQIRAIANYSDSGNASDLDDLVVCLGEMAATAGFWLVNKTESGRN